MRTSQEEIEEMNRRHLAIARMMEEIALKMQRIVLEAIIAQRLKDSRSK